MEGGGTEEIAQYMEKKIMSRLSTLAKYKKVGVQCCLNTLLGESL
jgi:hypothetical protein